MVDWPSVLIAEDDVLQAIALRMTLAEFGYTVCGVVDTAEAAIAQASRIRPDLAILDVALAGGSNGLEAARYLTRVVSVPVLVCSAHAVSWEATLSGAAFFLRKPYLAEELRSAIDTLSALAAIRHRPALEMDALAARLPAR